MKLNGEEKVLQYTTPYYMQQCIKAKHSNTKIPPFFPRALLKYLFYKEWHFLYRCPSEIELWKPKRMMRHKEICFYYFDSKNKIIRKLRRQDLITRMPF